jgi:hypothetical protein
VLHSTDARTICGTRITYSISVGSSNTCAASCEQAVIFLALNSGAGSCKSYYVESGVACLSSCDDPYDCYVSETTQSLNYDECTSPAGVAEETSTTDGQSDNLTCYKYRYSKEVSEDTPQERQCNDPDTTRVIPTKSQQVQVITQSYGGR